jgi:hypothetical protein
MEPWRLQIVDCRSRIKKFCDYPSRGSQIENLQSKILNLQLHCSPLIAIFVHFVVKKYPHVLEGVYFATRCSKWRDKAYRGT